MAKPKNIIAAAAGSTKVEAGTVSRTVLIQAAMAKATEDFIADHNARVKEAHVKGEPLPVLDHKELLAAKVAARNAVKAAYRTDKPKDD